MLHDRETVIYRRRVLGAVKTVSCFMCCTAEDKRKNIHKNVFTALDSKGQCISSETSVPVLGSSQ